MNFVVKIQEVIAQEREDALFECVLSHPLPRIRWMGKNSPLEDGEKHSITVSEDKLIHSLLIRDCKQLDKGIYAAIAGIKSCSAWLVVQGKHMSSGTTHKCASMVHLCRAKYNCYCDCMFGLFSILVSPDMSSMMLLRIRGLLSYVCCSVTFRNTLF